MRKLGYDDACVTYEFRSAGGDAARLPVLTRELLGMPLNVIVTDGTRTPFSGTSARRCWPVRRCIV